MVFLAPRTGHISSYSCSFDLFLFLHGSIALSDLFKMGLYGLNTFFWPQNRPKWSKPHQNDPKMMPTLLHTFTGNVDFDRFLSKTGVLSAKAGLFSHNFAYFWWMLAEFCIILPSLASFYLILQSTSENITEKSPNGRKNGLKWFKMAKTWSNNSRKRAQKGLKMVSKRHQNDPKMMPKGCQNDP